MAAKKKKVSMARKTSSLPTRVWSFGALPPRVNAHLAEKQVRLARLYYNDLLEVERGRAERYRQIRRAHSEELKRLEDAALASHEAVEEVYRQIREWRREQAASGNGKRRDFGPGQEDALEAAKEARKRAYEELKPARSAFEATLKGAREEWKERRKRLAEERGIRTNTDALASLNREVFEAMRGEDWPTAWKDLQRNDMDALERRKELRASERYEELTPRAKDKCWEAVVQAVKTHKFGMPWFKRPDGEGRIVVDFKKGTTFAMVMGGECRQLTLTPQRPTKIVRGKEVPLRSPSSRPNQFFMARVRVGRSKDKQWVEFPVRLDRVPPGDAQVRWAWFLSRRVGERIVWKFQITLEHASFAEPKRESGVGTTHIKIGWKKTEGGYQVAEGGGVSVVVPSSDEPGSRALAQRMTHHEQLQMYADDHLNEVLRVLRKLGLARRTTARRYRQQQRRNIVQWAEHSIGRERLKSLWHEWKVYRRSVGGDLFPKPRRSHAWARQNGIWEQRLVWWCYLWARKEEHLQEYAARQRRRSRFQRDELFRKEAIRIATQFETVTLDELDLAQLAKRPPTEETDQWARSRRTRQLVAPGRFKQILIEVMGKDRVHVVNKPSASASRKAKTSRATSKKGSPQGDVATEIGEVA